MSKVAQASIRSSICLSSFKSTASLLGLLPNCPAFILPLMVPNSTLQELSTFICCHPHVRPLFLNKSVLLLLNSFPWNAGPAMPACCQAPLKNLAKALRTLPVQTATKCCPRLTLVHGGEEGAAHKRTRSPTAKRWHVCLPQTKAQRRFLPSEVTRIHNWSNLCALLLVDSYASAISMVASRWHGLLAEEGA